jgi:hypothetical protein
MFDEVCRLVWSGGNAKPRSYVYSFTSYLRVPARAFENLVSTNEFTNDYIGDYDDIALLGQTFESH